MLKLTRSQKVGIEILENAEILQEGHRIAKCLWNQICWCQFGYNEKLRRQRGDDWDRYKRNLPYNRGVKYLGRFGIDKIMRDYWAAINISDFCFATVVQEFDIAMRSWFSNLKINPKSKPPKYSKARTLTFAIGTNAKPIGNMEYRLTVLGRAIKDRYAYIRLKLKEGIKMSDIKLIKIKPDGTAIVIHKIEKEQNNFTGLAAMDLGIVNLAAIAFDNGKSILFNGRGLLSSQQWGNKQSANCKPQNWYKGKSESRQSKKSIRYKSKAGNIQKLAVHNFTRFVINLCLENEVGTLIIGDLKGIRKDADHGKRGNQKLHNWPFAEIRRQLEYKAEEVGIEVIAISERNTSKNCSICNQKGIRNPRGILTCKNCNIQINSDVNGAFGILKKYLREKKSLGVEAIFPGLPSPENESRFNNGQRTGKVSQIHPTISANFDLRNWSVKQTICNAV